MNVEQVLNEFKKSGALLEGHFILSSGLHSDKFLQKALVFQEAYRVLKRGGRLAISDVVASAPFPEAMREHLALLSSCVTGAALIDEVEQMLQAAGFTALRIQPKDESKTFIREWVPDTKIEDYLVSATIEAVKP